MQGNYNSYRIPTLRAKVHCVCGDEQSFEIVVAQTAGFCMGVQRAVRLVLEAAEDPRTSLPIKTPGPLIHNRQVLQLLQRRGVLVMDEAPEGGKGTAVIRAHGLSREQQEDLRRRCTHLLDATCPHVRGLQQIVQEHAQRGYLCIVVGDRDHAEVEAVLSYADGRGCVVAGPEEVGDLPPAEKVVVVAQTTQNEQVFRAAVEKVRRRYEHCKAFETICRSTGQRQAEVRRLAGEVDAMIVVGGHNSANTRRLAEISGGMGTPTYHVETEQELDVDEILGYRRVGVTAGASTPNWMLRRVILRLRDEHRRRTHPVREHLRAILRALIYSNLFAAGALAALTYAATRLFVPPLEGWPLCMAVSFLFLLAQQLLNQYVRRESLYLSEPARSEFFMANERALFWMGVLSAAGCLVLALWLPLWARGVVALGLAGGLLYQLRWPGRMANRLGLRSLEQVPASKEVFVGLAWGTLAVLVPALSSGRGAGLWRSAAPAFVVCFLMAFQRTLKLDLRDVAADQLVGRETLAGLLGGRAVTWLVFVLGGLEGAVLTAAALAGWTEPAGLLLLASIPYGVVFFVLLRGRTGMEEDLAETLVTARFYLAGLLALSWHALAV